MPRSTKNPRDLTGRQAEILAARHSEELKERNSELATITPIDLGGEWDDNPIEVRPVPAEKFNDEGEIELIELEEALVPLRVNSDLEDVTIGQGNTQSFYVGKLYKVPPSWKAHFERLGYVYH